MSLSYKYRMLSGLESSGGHNMVWAEGATAAELATAVAASGSIGTLTGDPDSLYIFDGTTWNLIDKEGLASGVTYEGISPQTLLMVMKLLAVPMDTLNTVDTYDVLTTRGDILYRGETVPERLAKGTAGDVLMIGGNDPSWIAPEDLAFTDTNSNYTTDTIGSALIQLGPLLDADKWPEYIRTTKPTEQSDEYEGMLVYSTDTDNLQFCRTPGEQEIDTLAVTAGAVTKDGNVTITLNGADVVVAVLGGTAAVYNATITAAATASGDITITLDGAATDVAVVADDTAVAVAGKITTAYADDADWTVGNVDAVLTFTAKAKEAKSGAFSFTDTDTTGVTCTAGVTETTPGVDTDGVNDVATKIAAETYTGWDATAVDAIVTFVKAAVGACSAPAITDTDETGVTGAFIRTNEGVSDIWEGDGWHVWVPSLTWGTADPADVGTVARYMVQNHTLFFNISIASTDGNDASSLTISLPFPPKDNNALIPVDGYKVVNASWAQAFAYIDDGASNIVFNGFTTCTDGAALKIILAGQYEIA